MENLKDNIHKQPKLLKYIRNNNHTNIDKVINLYIKKYDLIDNIIVWLIIFLMISIISTTTYLSINWIL